jgi:hypothetical protein
MRGGAAFTGPPAEDPIDPVRRRTPDGHECHGFHAKPTDAASLFGAAAELREGSAQVVDRDASEGAQTAWLEALHLGNAHRLAGGAPVLS